MPGKQTEHDKNGDISYTYLQLHGLLWFQSGFRVVSHPFGGSGWSWWKEQFTFRKEPNTTHKEMPNSTMYLPTVRVLAWSYAIYENLRQPHGTPLTPDINNLPPCGIPMAHRRSKWTNSEAGNSDTSIYYAFNRQLLAKSWQPYACLNFQNYHLPHGTPSFMVSPTYKLGGDRRCIPMDSMKNSTSCQSTLSSTSPWHIASSA